MSQNILLLIKRIVRLRRTRRHGTMQRPTYLDVFFSLLDMQIAFGVFSPPHVSGTEPFIAIPEAPVVVNKEIEIEHA